MVSKTVKAGHSFQIVVSGQTYDNLTFTVNIPSKGSVTSQGVVTANPQATGYFTVEISHNKNGTIIDTVIVKVINEAKKLPGQLAPIPTATKVLRQRVLGDGLVIGFGYKLGELF